MINLNGQHAFAAALLIYGTTALAVAVASVVMKVIVVVGAIVLSVVAVLASRLRAPSHEAVNRIVHNVAVPTSLVLVLVVFVAALAWRL